MGQKISIQNAFGVLDEFLTLSIYNHLQWYEQAGLAILFVKKQKNILDFLEQAEMVDENGIIDIASLEEAVSYFTQRTPKFDISIASKNFTITETHIKEILNRIKEVSQD